MKIYSFATCFKEYDIFDIKYCTEKDFGVDQIILLEANQTFKGDEKAYNFKNISQDKEGVLYEQLDVRRKFIPNTFMGKLRLAYKRFLPSFYQKIISSPPWYNEAFQRSMCGYVPKINYSDDDILIFSDLDEILMPSMKEDLVNATYKYGIITVKLYFTMFYFNLVSVNWSGPSDYSYRLFMMTGEYFKQHHINYDKLRKNGENCKLSDEIYCYPKIAGFHHSWLGDKKFIIDKMMAYAHEKEHENGGEVGSIEKSLHDGISLFPGHILEIRNDFPFLPYILSHKDGKYKKYFLEK